MVTAKISPSWKQTCAHSHQQALQMAKSTLLTSLAVWDSCVRCSSLWLHADSSLCACVCVALMPSFSHAGSCFQQDALNTQYINLVARISCFSQNSEPFPVCLQSLINSYRSSVCKRLKMVIFTLPLVLLWSFTSQPWSYIMKIRAQPAFSKLKVKNLLLASYFTVQCDVSQTHENLFWKVAQSNLFFKAPYTLMCLVNDLLGLSDFPEIL